MPNVFTNVKHVNILVKRYLEELSVGDEAIVIHIVYTEREPQLRELVPLHAKLRYALDELFEIHLKRSNSHISLLRDNL